ncbi:MAG TPA: chemotaxis-specific protein-glutamate methyltransferase CheB [Longimicrobiales bacterium]|nr:chemotaxis-specific protein-glutamate methyltransferase CheB [Longimicrobiales bacterium]
MKTFTSEARRRRNHTVLVVDDSELMRSMLRFHIESAGSRFDVVGEAATGLEAIRQVHELDPDIVTLDLQMPDLGGVETLGYILSEAPRPVIIVTSQADALTEPTLQAMLLGAVEFVPKPATSSRDDVVGFRKRLLLALQAAATARLLKLPQRELLARRRTIEQDAGRPARCAVVVAASTGGPRALAEVLPQLPADLPAAVLVVQHMPSRFTRPFAERLDQACALPVREAEDNELVGEGIVLVAPGGRHLDLATEPDGVHVRLHDGPPVWGVRPAADPLFGAAARTFGPATVGVVMTGMGRDGAEGARLIRAAGGDVVVQDRDTSVIAGMPVAAAVHASAVVPLTELASAIATAATRRARARGPA